MFKWFKKYFIPHEKNYHRPHILRIEAILVLLSIILFIEVGFLVEVVVLNNTKFFASIANEALVSFTNFNRQTENLPELQVNLLLQQAAQLKADDMAKNSYFAHISPEGVDPWHWFDEVKYDYVYAGENLAINFIDSKDVEDAWMKSALHRANILNDKFTEIGIGISTGVFENHETTFIVQMFGSRAVPMAIETIVPKIVVPEVIVPETVAPETTIPEIIIPLKKIKEISPQDTSVAVKGASGEKLPTVEVQTQKGPEISIPERILATPRKTTNFLYAMLATILLLALVLMIFIKIKIQHPKPIIGGTVLLLIIASVFWLNHYLAFMGARIF
ncbi:MAG: CAP domain-containing protein [Patescibacteria group bacterium]